MELLQDHTLVARVSCLKRAKGVITLPRVYHLSDNFQFRLSHANHVGTLTVTDGMIEVVENCRLPRIVFMLLYFQPLMSHDIYVQGKAVITPLYRPCTLAGSPNYNLTWLCIYLCCM